MTDVRMSGPTLKILKFLLENVTSKFSGADMTKATKVGPGTLYPMLARLEVNGWVHSAWEDVAPSEAGRPRKRLYQLTGQGQRWAMNALSEFQVGWGMPWKA